MQRSKYLLLLILLLTTLEFVFFFTFSKNNIIIVSFHNFFPTEPARIDRTSPLPPGSDTELNIGAGRPDEPVEILENVTVRLYCPFTGLDQPTTRWVRVNRDRTTTDVVEMPPGLVLINETNNIILQISSFSEGFEGTYRCVTDNNAGDDDGDVVLRCKSVG